MVFATRLGRKGPRARECGGYGEVSEVAGNAEQRTLPLPAARGKPSRSLHYYCAPSLALDLGLPYLSLMAGRQDIGGRPIPGYGTYYFRLPSAALQNASHGMISLELHTGFEAEGLWTGAQPQVGLYEVRVIDLEKDSFPGREEFLQQVKLFQPEGGYFNEVLKGNPFEASQDLLEIGSGSGTLSCLMAAFTKANVWGIDLLDYRDPNPHFSQLASLIFLCGDS